MRRAALLIASLAAAVVVAEGLLRLDRRYRPLPRRYVGEQTESPSANFRLDPATGWWLVPRHSFMDSGRGGPTFSVVSNVQGMRDPDDFDGVCSRPRVILIGDSFVWGTGLEYQETIGAQLEDSLRHLADVLNLGMPGFGVSQMWMTLRHKALRLCPSVLVVAFVDPDWERSLGASFPVGGRWLSKPTFVVEGDTLRPASADDPRPGSVLRVAQRYSAIWRLVELATRRGVYAAGGGNWWTLNTMLIAAMARDARAANVPIVFVRLPQSHQRPAFPALAAWMARSGLDYVDLVDPSRFRRYIHLVPDGHFNSKGAAFAAGAVLEWLRVAGPPDLKTIVVQ